MQAQDRRAFLEVVLGFAELKGKTLSGPALELYWNAMQDWTLDEFKQAANALLKSSEFMPTPKDFYDLRRKMRPTAAEAWSLFPTDPRAKRALAIAAQGRNPGHIPLDELKWVQKRFMEVYDELTDVDDARESVPLLAVTDSDRFLSDGRMNPDHQRRMLALLEDFGNTRQ
jgi:hypothetical protein